MSLFIIFAPRWHDSTVLVADRRLTEHNELAITHKDKDGQRTFPRPFYLSGAVARRYPLEQMPTKAGGTIAVRAIPLDIVEKEIL